MKFLLALFATLFFALPAYVVKMIERRDQPGFDWETHLYFNYS